MHFMIFALKEPGELLVVKFSLPRHEDRSLVSDAHIQIQALGVQAESRQKNQDTLAAIVANKQAPGSMRNVVSDTLVEMTEEDSPLGCWPPHTCAHTRGAGTEHFLFLSLPCITVPLSLCNSEPYQNLKKVTLRIEPPRR